MGWQKAVEKSERALDKKIARKKAKLDSMHIFPEVLEDELGEENIRSTINLVRDMITRLTDVEQNVNETRKNIENQSLMRDEIDQRAESVQKSVKTIKDSTGTQLESVQDVAGSLSNLREAKKDVRVTIEKLEGDFKEITSLILYLDNVRDGTKDGNIE